MKFIHISDVHLGARPDAGPLYTRGREKELWDTFEYVLNICEQEQADLLLIAGDLFHRQPLRRELKEVDALFSRLTHTKVVFIAGNHDFIRRDSNYSDFHWSDNVYPLFGKEIEYFDFPELGTAVYGLSYHSREIKRPLYARLSPQGAEPVEILLAHGGDEKHIPIDRRELEKAGFSYVALGHIHKPHALAKDRIVYSGALEPVDKNDTGAHGYIKGEIKGGRVRVQWIPCAKREYIHKEIVVDENDTQISIREKTDKLLEEFGNENIYKITLKGRRDPDVRFSEERICERGNIMEVEDRTEPAYDIGRLARENRDNLIGRYISRFEGYEEDSIEYEALCEGVDALLGTE